MKKNLNEKPQFWQFKIIKVLECPGGGHSTLIPSSLHNIKRSSYLLTLMLFNLFYFFQKTVEILFLTTTKYWLLFFYPNDWCRFKYVNGKILFFLLSVFESSMCVHKILNFFCYFTFSKQSCNNAEEKSTNKYTQKTPYHKSFKNELFMFLSLKLFRFFHFHSIHSYHKEVVASRELYSALTLHNTWLKLVE